MKRRRNGAPAGPIQVRRDTPRSPAGPAPAVIRNATDIDNCRRAGETPAPPHPPRPPPPHQLFHPPSSRPQAHGAPAQVRVQQPGRSPPTPIPLGKEPSHHYPLFITHHHSDGSRHRFFSPKRSTIGRGAPCGRPSWAVLASGFRCDCPGRISNFKKRLDKSLSLVYDIDQSWPRARKPLCQR